MTMSENIRKMTYAAVCLVLCLVLPSIFTGNIQQLGQAISPMHIPVLLCGFIAGPAYAVAVGFAAPLLRFMMVGMPPLFPIGISMCFELAVYGFAAGMMYRMLPKKTDMLYDGINIYASLITAMLAGRVVGGLVMWRVLTNADSAYSLNAFLTAYFVTPILGIIIHLIIIPSIVISLRKAKLL